VAQCLEPELIAAHLYGNTTSHERTVIRRHIAECDSCRKLIAAVVKSESAMPDTLSTDLQSLDPNLRNGR
jgi:predicted anti-sigma-YlaC factor YlaD